jgi:hypothetical protein
LTRKGNHHRQKHEKEKPGRYGRAVILLNVRCLDGSALSRQPKASPSSLAVDIYPAQRSAWPG